jgi:hypothetical protein
MALEMVHSTGRDSCSARQCCNAAKTQEAIPKLQHPKKVPVGRGGKKIQLQAD